ncbi:primosomal protein N' [Bacillus sp. AFS077874]|uniref:primosomal protein N' n=1 Tax=unclassified Bacillus (in: firmicutes) TaxID=185979 RepID=UPI000BED0D96|nr:MULTISPECIES: primosomal protein N' [unclassified Bacillus (in: firmicutes)]PEC49780.1 primosomal protein N' [Bacillus sp. AFS096315]PFM79545.1 primosomal protein N' [Bacillus sp. AFS077874]
MTYASVLVDVSVRQTDRPFDYKVPTRWQDAIQPGMRVIVPFGPRKVQGFVLSIKETTNVEKVKEIEEVLDVMPVLTEELLLLGSYLSQKTLCFFISAYQAMLPTAIKAVYKKHVQVTSEEALDQLAPELANLFSIVKRREWTEIESLVSKISLVQRAIKEGLLEIEYEVKNKANKKTERVVSLLKVLDEELPIIKSPQQKDIIEYLRMNGQTSVKELKECLGITDSPIKTLEKNEVISIKTVEVYRDPYEGREIERSKPLPLIEEQQIAFEQIVSSFHERKNKIHLLHGVTGSGKTEVYLQAIQVVLSEGKEAIVLVPEISLTPQIVGRFKSRFGNDVAVLHSGLSIGEKYDEWRKIQRKEVKVVVGARSAIFAPFENIGMIIIDEEHETTYKQDEHPRYHARDIAIWRGEYHHCPIVLGSATPTLESFARAGKGVYELNTMSKRVNQGPLPEVEIVDMREQLRIGNRTMFSTALHEKILDRLEKKEQIILFLNRRGYSSFVMCRDCGYTIQCPHCEVSLTYHKHNHHLKCHYCGYETYMPKQCPSCQSEHIRFFGTGTQKVEEAITKTYPEARVIRMDNDTTSRKGAHEKMLKQFGNGEADILLGTQMIAKGLDFPNVTLVGVLAADSSLHLPDFRASERTFSLLTQVSGRAGRHEKPGEVVIQTYSPEHYSIELAKTQDYVAFYEEEMKIRRSFRYPPFYYLVLISIAHNDLIKTVKVSEQIAGYLREYLSEGSIVLGPVASPIAKIKDHFRYQCVIKYKSEPALYDVLNRIQQYYQDETDKGKLQLTIDFQPTMFM